MTTKFKTLLAAGVAAIGLTAANSANADIVFCNGGGCASQGDTVHLPADNDGNNTVTGYVNGVPLVTVTGLEPIHTTTPGNDPTDVGGQAWIQANDYVAGQGQTPESGGLTSLTFSIAGGLTFDTLEFRLTPVGSGNLPDWTLNFTAIDDQGTVFTETFGDNSPVGDLLGNNEFFNAYTINGQHIKSVSFVTSTDIAKVAQIRISGIDGSNGGNGGIPEPATWALMIMGFGSAGAMLRRRRAAFA